MDLSEYLDEARIQLGTTAANKDDALREMAELAVTSEAVDTYSSDDIYRALKAREEIGSTGFGQGIAIPHCGLPDATDFVVGVLAAPEGIDFDSHDQRPARLLVFIVGPKDQRNEHVRLLSAISKILADNNAVEELLAAASPTALRESFLRHHTMQLAGPQKEKVLFHVFVQDEDKFAEILQIFSGAVHGELMVVDAENAGSYLNRMPLFAALWSEQQQGFGRLVIGVVDKSLSNDVIRRLHTEVQSMEEQSGIMVTAQELMYACGSLDF